MNHQGPIAAGELVLLLDRKGRRYQFPVEPGKQFHSHAGYFDHDALIGVEEGSVIRTTRNQEFTILRPTLSDYIFKMPRGAQVIYPKDIGPILMLADIFPGARVLESGVGSGALSMGMLRAGARITGYELRDDFAQRAQQNVAGFLGEEAMSRYDVQVRDCYEGIDETGLDRIVLDLPEPWQVVKHARRALVPGGIILAYTPSAIQVSQFRDAIAEGGFILAETLEVLHRTWHVEGQAVRPDHRMVAHTGFLSHARRLAD